jgi:hypothetical protein
MHSTALKPIELTGRTDGVSAHVPEAQPVSHDEVHRKVSYGANTIDGITSWPPDAACCLRNFAGIDRPGEVFTEGNDVRVNVLVIEHDTVERSVNPIIYVI